MCWLNADDYYLPGGLNVLLRALEEDSEAPAAYGRCWTVRPSGRKLSPYWTMGFRPWVLANFCFICQPGTLIRRAAWEKVGGLNENLRLALDYDLWWRIYRQFGPLRYSRDFVAATVMHRHTKTATHRRAHYQEAMSVVREHTGRIPVKWYLAWPFMVSARAAIRGTDTKVGR